MQFNLDQKDHEIFSALYTNPFLNYNKLSKEVDMAPATVKDRVLKMKQDGFLRPDRIIDDPIFGNRQQTEVIASYDPRCIGLERLFALFEGVNNAHTLKKILDFCDLHPYTHYRSVSYKNPLSVYVQFDIPPVISTKIQATLYKVATELEIANLLIFSCNNHYYTYPDFSTWSLFKREWDIDKESQKSSEFIDGLWYNYLKSTNVEISKLDLQRNNEYKMSPVDAKLLRELTINAKVSLKLLNREYNLTTSVLSRYLSRLKNKVINKGILLYDEAFFGMNNLQVIFGKFNKHSALDATSLITFTQQAKLPIQGNISVSNDYFVIETFASPIITTELSKFLWENTDPNNFNSNQIHVPSTLLYYFYNENYIDKGEWRIDNDYIHNAPLQKL